MKGSFALLLFVILGYMVKFYPEMLVNFDQSIQTAIRGDLPDYLTILFRALTRLIDIPVIITWVVITAFVFYRKRWKIESFFMLGNLALAGLLIVTFKISTSAHDQLSYIWWKRRDFPSQVGIL